MESPMDTSAVCLPNNTGLDFLYNTNYHTNFHELFFSALFIILGENGRVSRFNSGDLAVLLTRIIMN